MRGDQPDAAGCKWLAAHGVGVLVNLRLRNRDRAVRKAAPELRPVHIPVKNDCPPSDEQALQWLELCRRQKSERAVFVHCRGGKGRTSTFCALVRAAQRWPFERAIEEQRRFGFEPEGMHRRQAAYLESFFERLANGRLRVAGLSPP